MDTAAPATPAPAPTAAPTAASTAASTAAPTETDALIIGAGPVGLFQVFELGLQEIRCHVLDSLPMPGGQCIELYPDKPIYDIPAIPVCTGRQLTDNLLAQCAPFSPGFDLGSQVERLSRQADGRLLVGNTAGRTYLTRTLFIAAGAGSFQPQPLPVPDIECFEGTQLLYRVRDREALRGRRIVICGGGDAALDWANDLVDVAADVTLVHRRDSFRAAPASVARMRQQVAAGRLKLEIAHTQGFEQIDTSEGPRLTALTVQRADGSRQTLETDLVLAFFGLSPKLGPIADWGLEIEGRQLRVNTENFETSEPAIFAIGDINTYPGKKKLILSGFHEAALAAFGATRYVFPDKKVYLQYTTTSTRLHKVLGVDQDGAPTGAGQALQTGQADDPRH